MHTLYISSSTRAEAVTASTVSCSTRAEAVTASTVSYSTRTLEYLNLWLTLAY